MSRTADQTPDTAAVPQAVVYFVGIGKHIKIGFTTNLQQRLKAFLTSSPDVDLLLAIPGDRAMESMFHNRLEECRIAREMFRHDYRITQFIAHYEYGGLARGMEFLDATTSAAQAKQKAEDRTERVAVARKTKAEKDAYFAGLVAERKQRLGW